MKNNIFENAFLGKAYKTRDDRKAIYCESYENSSHTVIHRLLSKGPFGFRLVNTLSNGNIFSFRMDKDDIVSEWKEEVNEEELDKLAMTAYAKSEIPVPYDDCSIECIECYKIGFRAGVNWKN